MLKDVKGCWNHPHQFFFIIIHSLSLSILYHDYIVTMPGNYMFEGAKSELVTRISPSFHVMHNFSLGPPHPGAQIYSFGTSFETDKVMIMIIIKLQI
jgi:hypothetical protein